MRHLDLFSGIGGFALAASWVWGNKHEIVGFCEIDEFCQKVLKKHWPDVPIYPDIKELKGNQFDAVELITGGFPCQPYSIAGKRQGAKDDRHLWPEMFRIIREVKPRWIIAENVPGIVNMELDQVLSALENEGYDWESFIIPAAGVDAPHKRDRVWIVAHSQQFRWRGGNNGNAGRHSGKIQIKGSCSINQSKILADSDQPRLSKFVYEKFGSIQKKNREPARSEFGGRNAAERQWATWPAEPGLDRVANGIPNRVDRIIGLGNAIVPQVVAILLQIIKDLDYDHLPIL